MIRARCALFVVSIGIALAVSSASPKSQASSPQAVWFKGNLHTHTLNSDGDSTPDDVVRWYREHGYNFVAITDHNYLTSVDGLNAVHGADDKFLVVKGEEVTDRFGDKPRVIKSTGRNLPLVSDREPTQELRLPFKSGTLFS